MTTPTPPPARPATPPPPPAASATPTTAPAPSKTPIPIGPILLGVLLALAALILWSADQLGWLTTGIIAAVLALLILAGWLGWRARKRSRGTGRTGGGLLGGTSGSSRSPLGRLRAALPRALGGTRGTGGGSSSRPGGILGRIRAGLPGRLGGSPARSTTSGSTRPGGGSRTGGSSVFGPSNSSRRPAPVTRNTSSHTGSKTNSGNGSSGTSRPSSRPSTPPNTPPERQPIGFTRRTPAPAAPEGGSPMAAANDGSEMGLIAWNRRVKQAAGPLGDMAGFIGRLATESERQPVPQSVTDELRALASQQKRISERVAEIHGNVRKTNETDYARAETPRRGSISVEAKADVTRSTREG